MLIGSPSSRSAFHVPLLLTALSLGVLPGLVAIFANGFSWRGVWAALVGVLLIGFTSSELRKIGIRHGQLVVRNIFGTKTTQLDRIAVGVRVRHGRGHRYYTTYAFDGSREIELATAHTQKGSEKLRRRLESILLAERFGLAAAPAASVAAQTVVNEREARYQRQQAQAQRIVNQHYKSGKPVRYAIWIGVGILTWSLGVVAYAQLFSAG